MVNNKMPSSIRVKVPVSTLPNSPYIQLVTVQGNRLDRLILASSTTGFTNDAGIRIRGIGGMIYPAAGSVSDSNFAGGRESFGALPPSGTVFDLPLDLKLEGPPYAVTLEFYNDSGTAVLGVNVILLTHYESPVPYVPKESQPAEVKQ